MNTAIQERDLRRVRLRLLDLCKSFFDTAPDAEKLARWRGIFAALAGAKVTSAFDREAGVIASLLWAKSLARLQHEYYRVLAGPLGAGRIATLKKEGPVTAASFRRDDLCRPEPLTGIRELMAEAGLARNPAATVPEGSLVALLDIMAALVEEESAEGDWPRELQGRLLAGFLLPLAERLVRALEQNIHADFYLRCSRLLCSYLELEMELADDHQEGGEWEIPSIMPSAPAQA